MTENEFMEVRGMTENEFKELRRTKRIVLRLDVETSCDKSLLELAEIVDMVDELERKIRNLKDSLRSVDVK